MNNPKRLKLLCDKLWREEVIKLYGAKCVICGDDKINIHHIVGRRNKSTRWYRGNGVPLCAGHHTFFEVSAHQHPLWFRNEMIRSRGEDWERDLNAESNKIWSKDFNKVKQYLNWEVDSYNVL